MHKYFAFGEKLLCALVIITLMAGCSFFKNIFSPKEMKPPSVSLLRVEVAREWGWWFYSDGSLFERRWLLWIYVFSVLGPQIANQAGWITAEVGRQPWVVYGLLKTSDAVSKTITAGNVLTSLIMFTIIYILLFAVFLYTLNQKIKHGPDEVEAEFSKHLA